ncbi:MAG: hypothetical protein IT206_07130 [Fimbriimonadaceae bacterium]|nr:hypothetical protein [Fimbriimonadaceae bacterium]
MPTIDDVEFVRIGIIQDSDDPYAGWYAEVLAHAGLRATSVSEFTYDGFSKFDILLFCGRGTFHDQELIGRWLSDARRSIVVSGGSWELEKLLGIKADPLRFSSGQIAPSEAVVWPDGAPSAIFFGGCKAHTTQAQALATTTDGHLAVSRNGSAWLVSPHVGQTMAFLQMGTSVEAHGVGPSDGSAQWDEGPLRAEFGSRLGFEARQDGLFQVPHADIVREMWIRTVLEAIAATGKRAAILWHLPGGATHAGLLSLDCDINNPSILFQLNSALSMTGSKATFLSRGASFPPEIYGWMRQTGHEVGLSFHEGWRPERARLAITNLTRIAGGQVLTAAIARGAWLGFSQPYEAFAQAGVHAVLGKGGTERGTAGFIFGSSHPFIARPTSAYEIPFQSFGGNWDERVINPTKKRYGVIHSMLPLSMVQEADGFAGLKRWVSLVKQSGGDYFTAERLIEFERARRGANLVQERGNQFVLEADAPMGTATVLVTGRDLVAESGRKAPQLVTRYGKEFTAITLEMGDSKSGAFLLHEEDRKAA